ncbi:MAG: bifunctional 4-hydroxy-2-oxoglutarate aldolase/2-dehydro-3-deoxy-phosphogluconate aldolase [Candidatus Omnitrophica bacterium]|nr:bifunctional 4-hydroxy-2-oxoglutarate aldolase/2-dehydro-3-deoxy-phosphogluconate aldolase [Candidatus Omnitrophota bacterium]
MDLEKFREIPILGILRGVSQDALEPLLDAVVESGLKTVEFAMNSSGAAGLIKKAVSRYGKRLTIGAGTVMSLRDLKTALQAGATFAVSPVVVDPVVRYCARRKIPVFPGALTPSEVYHAWRAGATMVKVFPARCFGPDYFRDLAGPFPQIELLACSGVTPENLGVYFKSGASAIAVGAGVFRKDWIAARKFHLIRDLLGEYLEKIPVVTRSARAKFHS